MRKSLFLTVSTVALVSVAILNQGCAIDKAPSNMVWFNPDKTPQQTMVDMANCRIMARQLAPNTPIATDEGGVALLGIMADNKRANGIYNDCMISKEYSLVNKKSPLLKNSQPTQPISTSNEDTKAVNDLIGQWKSVSFKGKTIGSGVEQIEFAFLPKNQFAEKTIQNGETYTQNGQYTVRDKKLILGDNKTSADSADFTLKGDLLVIRYPEGNVEITLHRRNPLVNPNSTVLANSQQSQPHLVESFKAKAESGDADAQFQLGCFYDSGSYGATKDYTEAIKWYQKAAHQNYANIQLPLASAYAKRGVLEQSKGDLDGAMADFNKAIEIKPDFTETYTVRGLVKQYKGDLDGAIADYNKAIELNPYFVIAYYCRGLLNYDSHKFIGALTDFRKSCESASKVQDYSYFRFLDVFCG